MINKNFSFVKKLTSKNLMIIAIINILLPIVSCLMIERIIHFQLEYHLLNTIPDNYYRKLMILILLFDGIVLGVIDYLFIISPFLHLEEVVEEYSELADMDINHSFDKRFVKSSLEQNFLDMLGLQKEFLEQTKRAEDQMLTTELYALQTQINPHFLYNTLDSIRGLALIHGVVEISSMTEALSCLFRSMIAKEGKMLHLREEFENVKNYLAIQNFRFSGKFTYECKVEPDIMDQYLIHNMTLQPIVENAIMHGLEKKLGKGKITISAFVTEKRLVLSVTDDGVGIEEEKLNYLNEKMRNNLDSTEQEAANHQVGIALLNINKRIKLKFGDRYGIYLFSTLGIATTAELVLPAISASSLQQRERAYE